MLIIHYLTSTQFLVKVTDGLDVIDTIASVQTAEGDKPVEDVVILGVTVSSS